MVGNTTLLVGTEDERVGELVDILKQYCSTHKKVTSTADSLGRGLRPDGIPPKITVGGATYFVLNVDNIRFANNYSWANYKFKAIIRYTKN